MSAVVLRRWVNLAKDERNFFIYVTMGREGRVGHLVCVTALGPANCYWHILKHVLPPSLSHS